MLEQFKAFISKFNSKGIPLPLARDPKTGVGSVSLTLLFISSLFVEVGLIGKYSKLLDGIDIQQALNWFLICAGLYMGRTLATKGVTASVDAEKSNNVQS